MNLKILENNDFTSKLFLEQKITIQNCFVDRFSKFLLHSLGQTKYRRNVLPTIKLFRIYLGNAVIRD